MSTLGAPPLSLQRYRNPSLVVGIFALLGTALGYWWDAQAFFRAYLVAYNFWLGLALGSLVILMVQYLTGGTWGLLLRRILEAGTRTLPLLALFFIPVLIGIRQLYPWAQSDAELPSRQWYFHEQFFALRAVVAFACWLFLAVLLNRWSVAQDRGFIRPLSRRFRLLSGPGIVLYGLTITFVSIDWVMSLEPNWVSTIFPPLFAVSQLLNAMTFSILLFLALAGEEPLRQMMRPSVQRDMGNLLLTFVMLWAYMSFSQFLLIWSENLPEEIPWYLRRVRGGWQILAVVLLVFQFALPFLLLLSRDVKQNPRALGTVACLILLMRFLDLYWWIEPSSESPIGWTWILDVAAWLGIGGIIVWWLLGSLQSRPLLPPHDPRLAVALEPGGEHA
jgi:hypothetical protein